MTDNEPALFARIDNALSRIETALASRPAPRASADHAHLAARHDALRNEVAKALSELNAIGEGRGQDG